MGEEEKKPETVPEEKKMEEKKTEEPKKTEEVKKPQEKPADEKKEEKKAEGSKDSKDEKTPPPPPPPQEIVLKVYMHCEGCARKVRRSLKGFQGVEDVMTDCKTHKVVVKGEKADPLKVLARVQRKSHRQVELIYPIPPPPSTEEKKPKEEEKPKPEEKKEEPKVITVILKVYMHCEACAMEIKKRILKMKGVESADPDLKSSQVTVKGIFSPQNLVDYVYKRTGKQATIVKQEPEKTEGVKKTEEGGGEKEKEKEKKSEETVEKKEDGDGKAAAEVKAEEVEETTSVIELRKNEYYYHPQRYSMEMYAYPPQIFSDENPNACIIM